MLVYLLFYGIRGYETCNNPFEVSKTCCNTGLTRPRILNTIKDFIIELPINAGRNDSD
jgi:hypothetical protein